MTQASKEPGDLGVLGLYRGTPISYEFPLPVVGLGLVNQPGNQPKEGARVYEPEEGSGWGRVARCSRI